MTKRREKQKVEGKPIEHQEVHSKKKSTVGTIISTITLLYISKQFFHICQCMVDTMDKNKLF